MKTLFPYTYTHLFRRPVLALAVSALLAGPAGAAAPATFSLNDSAALKELKVGDKTVSFDAALGGFHGQNVTSGKPLDFSKGVLKKSGDKTTYEVKDAGGVSLEAEFIPKDGYLLVTGRLKKTDPDDMAVILDYRVGFTGKDAVFSNSVNSWEEGKISGDAENEGNAFPVAALQTADSAVAMAIPPLEPRSFGMVGSAKGLTTRFYLGITPITKAFPNEASFNFMIYPSKPGWGFRSALESYYDFFPDQYTFKPKQMGNYMYMVKGYTPENVDQYSFNVLEVQNPKVESDIKRDNENNILSLAYTIVGQREVKFLDKLPANYDEAMEVFANWKVEDHKKHPVVKENIGSNVDEFLREEVENSACKGPDGKYVAVIRRTPWGKNSVSFKMNPSPYLFEGTDKHTVGGDSTATLRDWLKKYPDIDGVTVDSLGANWPATANYRRDHFEYAQYPLTFDPEGRLFLHNETSHFEWVKYVADMLAKDGKFLFANGVYAYRTQIPEHFRAKDKKTRIKVGRFFISAVLQGAASEGGTRSNTDRCQDTRIMMGRKYYSLTNYDWENREEVEEFYNRSLAFGIFASNTKNYFGGGEYIENVHEGVSYLESAEGYGRDKELLKWFVPKAITLNKAGWQPETFARITTGGDDKLYLERFGKGDDLYFTVYNESPEKKEITVKFDFPALGFTEGTANFQEVARSEKLETVDADQVKLTVEPHKTYIINVSKTWLWGML